MAAKTFTLIATLAALAAATVSPYAAAQSEASPPAASDSAAPAANGPTGAGHTMYRWVDKNNTVHYSDRPQPGAQAVPVQSSQTYSAPKAPAPVVARSPSPASSGPPAPTCGITSPTADQAFPNAQSVTISYRGPSGGQAELLLNGESKQTLPAGQAFTISPVPRGTYSATVAITSDTGAALCRTPPVTFHVTQPSLLSPVRQQAPRPTPRAN
jgi:hypothetical protein